MNLTDLDGWYAVFNTPGRYQWTPSTPQIKRQSGSSRLFSLNTLRWAALLSVAGGIVVVAWTLIPVLFPVALVVSVVFVGIAATLLGLAGDRTFSGDLELSEGEDEVHDVLYSVRFVHAPHLTLKVVSGSTEVTVLEHRHYGFRFKTCRTHSHVAGQAPVLKWKAAGLLDHDAEEEFLRSGHRL